MTRLDRKCFVASTLFHALLFAILLLSPAWMRSKHAPDNLPILEVIPSRLIDEAASGGGTPNATPPPPAPPQDSPPQVQPQPEPSPPQPDPKPPERTEPETPPKPKPEPKKPKPEPEEKPLPEDAKTPPRKPAEKPTIKLSTNIVRRNPKEREDAKARAQYEARLADARRAAQERQDRIAGSLQTLSKQLSTGTLVGIPGPGGEAYANYGQAIKSIYFRAWNPPREIEDESLTVETEIVIAKDGTVLRAACKIIQGSGNTALDKSVQQTLDRVTHVGRSFPETAKENQRTFRVFFNLKARRALG